MQYTVIIHTTVVDQDTGLAWPENYRHTVEATSSEDAYKQASDLKKKYSDSEATITVDPEE